MKQTTIEAIEQLVSAIAVKAAKSDTKLREQLEAGRVLAPYYSALRRHKPPQDDHSDGEMTMGTLHDQLQELEEKNGRTVSSHSRGRGKDSLEN